MRWCVNRFNVLDYLLLGSLWIYPWGSIKFYPFITFDNTGIGRLCFALLINVGSRSTNGFQTVLKHSIWVKVLSYSPPHDALNMSVFLCLLIEGFLNRTADAEVSYSNWHQGWRWTSWTHTGPNEAVCMQQTSNIQYTSTSAQNQTKICSWCHNFHILHRIHNMQW